MDLRPLTLLQLQRMVADAIRASAPGRGVWVVAELVDVRSSGGHCYLELIEKDASGATVAKLRGNIWRSHLMHLRRKFYDATGSDIRSGLKVMVGGTANFHPLYGLSFTIEDIDPSYTLGDMERLRREILERLSREGVIDFNKRLEMPLAPQKIAVISSDTAAGYGDFIDQLCNNADGLVFYPCLFQSIMQGERTSLSVRGALARIEESVDFWDCVAIIRGGGATTDLNGFDDYELAKAVATFPLPIVVGIGHERDRTVLDEIANTRIKTPTGVAAFFVDRNRNALAQACTIVDYITRYATDYVNGEHRRLTQLAGMLPALASSRVETAKSSLASVASLIPSLASSHLQRAQSRLASVASTIPAIASARSASARIRLESITQNLKMAPTARLQSEARRLQAIEAVTQAYSPENTLRRGYSITTINGHAIRSADEASAGATIVSRLSSGYITSKVIAPDESSAKE